MYGNVVYDTSIKRKAESDRSYATLIDEEDVIREYYVNGFEGNAKYVG